MDDSRRIDKIFLLHLWACVPFAPLWLLYSEAQPDPSVVRAMRVIAATCAVYLVARTWTVFRGPDTARWALAWPVIDVLLVTAILIGLGSAEDPTGYLYLLAIAYATLKLPARQAVFIVALSVLGQFMAGVATHTWTPYFARGEVMYVAFRHFFLLLLASLIFSLSRYMQEWRERLALTDYQRELSAEMHDGIQHDLTLIARRLDLAGALAEADPPRAAAIAMEQRDVARRASDELRLLVRQLRPDAPPYADFAGALERHLAVLSERWDVPISLKCAGALHGFPAAYQHPVFRITQEAVGNAVKHGRARRIRVALRRRATGYTLGIADDGEGFDPQKTEAGGYGLETIRARTEALGGRRRIASRPGGGTHLVIRLPLAPPERRRGLG